MEYECCPPDAVSTWVHCGEDMALPLYSRKRGSQYNSWKSNDRPSVMKEIKKYELTCVGGFKLIKLAFLLGSGCVLKDGYKDYLVLFRKQGICRTFNF